jgi:hypothetical protein
MRAIRIVAVSAVLVAGLAQASVANALSQDVRIVRGGQPASITEVQEAGVRVFRGTPMTRLASLDGNNPDPKPSVQALSSGSNIWFVDRAAGELSVCRLAKTTQIGEHRIDCYSRALPR